VAIELVWRPQARDDLLEIYLVINLDKPAVADRVFDAIEAKARLLAMYPRLGPRRPEIRPSVRILVERPYLILYETHPDTDDGPIEMVEIVRVVDGRRDLVSLF
jgi:toxin ParE1/3/4